MKTVKFIMGLMIVMLGIFLGVAGYYMFAGAEEIEVLVGEKITLLLLVYLIVLGFVVLVALLDIWGMGK